MKYKITRQYARDIELPLVEFDDQVDAQFFIKIKLESDRQLHVAAIYRLYHDKKLIDVINHGKLNVSGIPEHYFSDEGTQHIHNNAYKIDAQYLNNPATPSGNMVELKDARLFIEKKLRHDLELNKKITYRIFKSNTMLEKFNPLQPEKPVQNSTDNKATFHPTPFRTQPKPAGSPLRWVGQTTREQAKDEKEKEV